MIITSVLCYAIKYAGHAIPEIWLAHPRVQRITNIIPIVLLSALVAMQAFTTKTKFEVDHRLAGINSVIESAHRKARRAAIKNERSFKRG